MSSEPKLAFGVEPSDCTYRLRLARYQGLAELVEEVVEARERAGAGRPQVLEVGSGKGRTWLYLAARGLTDRIALHGVDISSERFSYMYHRQDWKLLQADVTRGLPLADAAFDLIICEQILEHLPDPDAVIAEIGRVLRPGGTLLLGVPIFPPVLGLIRRHVIPFFDRRFGITRTHIQAFTLGTIRRAVDRTGRFRIRRARGYRLISGGILKPLENHRWWWRLNRWLGNRLPGLCTEVQLLCERRPME